MCPNHCGHELRPQNGAYVVGQVCDDCEQRATQRYLEQNPLSDKDNAEIAALQATLRAKGFL